MRQPNRWKWLESGGGPLILLPDGLPWRGAPFNADPLSTEHDYGRACAVRDYAGVVQAGRGTALILSDEPLATAWVPSPTGGRLVRWGHAPDETAAIDAFDEQAGVELATWTWDVTVPTCDLFDSAWDRPSAKEWVRVALQPGTYRMSTVLVEPSREIRLVLHELRLIDGRPATPPPEDRSTDASE